MYIMIHTFGSCRSISGQSAAPYLPKCSKAFALEHVYRNTPFGKNKRFGILDKLNDILCYFLFFKMEYCTKTRNKSREKLTIMTMKNSIVFCKKNHYTSLDGLNAILDSAVMQITEF